jgi:hypothetical protein
LSVAGLACAQPVHVQVDRRGELIVIDVDARTLVDPQLAFAVLTDYEHMASFVSALKSSSARRTGPHTLEVEQVAQAKVAFMDFKVWSVRAVELLPPREVRSHLVRGDFKSYDFVTRVGPHPEGGTLVTHHGEYVPNAWLPPMIGPAVIRQQTERQYEELIAEMERRAGLPARDAAAAPRGGDAAVGR